jgi:hypothetical protein
MKRRRRFFGAILFALAIIISCGGSSVESDAKKVAELQCKSEKILQKATSVDISIMEESAKLASEAASLSKKMERKYTSDSDKKKFAEALLKEMSNCK